MHTIELLTKRIQVAGKKVPADLVIQNGTIVNVFTGEFMKGDIAVVDGIIAGVGSYREGKQIIDASGQWIVPGLIDGHVHIESSMLTPPQFARVVVQHGVTSVITDPHEIGNVMGAEGIQYMLDQSRNQPVDIYANLPSCVPCTPFETSGARLEADELRPFYFNDKVLGLAEVMDFPALASADSGLLQKLADAIELDAHIDGHAAGINREQLNLYMAAGIRTDHESVNAEEARHRLDLGMYVMIREGTAAKDLQALLPAVTPRNSRRCLFVTDDKLIDDLIEEGSVDHCVRLAIRFGLDPITAIQMATINAAECFGLRDRGAVAPGYIADFIIVDDLKSLSIRQVYKRGRCVYADGELQELALPAVEASDTHAVAPVQIRDRLKSITAADLRLAPASSTCNIIGIIPNSLVTSHIKAPVQLDEAGCFIASAAEDLMKLAVIERHHGTGNIGLGIVQGFGFAKGAIVSTVAHDSHNIICAGVSDADMVAAIAHVTATNGGLAVVADGEVLASLSLPVGGLMSSSSYQHVYSQMKELNRALRAIEAPEHFNPFLTLSFLALPVIPQLKLTDKGLFDFAVNSHIGIEAE
ncbi:adenine deaminase [Paenibacillus curdlanolyticus YK9]|uniref:Adenine deaminase n=1 Tax=Paenibacillus curdlanolyticus YK9 TaxID=717606 RepID=E0I4M7_9BACL|nr:adenine deaminase [Paenibacillus curdlanolyticus]EFM12558.1 adenine deaminase [Paenibacillus curdlanolyticus YK9]